MTNKQKARIAVARGGAIKDVAERYGISVNTLKSWSHRRKKKQTNAPQVAPKVVYEWRRSIHHETAHLVNSVGEPLCSASPAPMSYWHPAEDTPKCKRCMGQQNKI